MARKLPWASKTPNTAAPINAVTTTRPSPAKRRKTSPSTDDASITSPDDLDRNAKRTKTAQPSDQERQRERDQGRNKGKSRGRTPSTSPPPAPPDVEFMREGIDADDGYMMVEDEFNDIAKTFTAHLHHAEYKRLMKEAQARKQTQRTDVNANETGMSTDEIQRRSVAKTLRLDQGKTLKDEAAEADDGGNEVMTREEQRVGDPWAGTTLAGLMRYEPGRDRLSLRGLQGVPSGSRAALGFGPNEDVDAHASVRRRDETLSSTSSSRSRNLGTERLALPQAIKKDKNKAKMSSSSFPRTKYQAAAIVLDESSDDLDTTRRAKTPRLKNTISDSKNNNHSVKIKAVELNTTTTTTTITTSRPAVIKSEPGQHPKNPVPRAAVRKFIDDLDDFDDALFDKNKDRNQNDDDATVGPSTSSSNMKETSWSRNGNVNAIHRPYSREVKLKIKKERIKEEEGDDSVAAAAVVVRRKRLSERLDEVPVFLA